MPCLDSVHHGTHSEHRPGFHSQLVHSRRKVTFGHTCHVPGESDFTLLLSLRVRMSTYGESSYTWTTISPVGRKESGIRLDIWINIINLLETCIRWRLGSGTMQGYKPGLRVVGTGYSL